MSRRVCVAVVAAALVVVGAIGLVRWIDGHLGFRA